MALFKDINPELLQEYDYTLNADKGIDLVMISQSSNIRVFWKCSKCGGVWEASFAERNRHKGCPYCSGKRILKGYNDLATKFPEIVAEWDFEKNAPLLPTEVAPFSNKDVYWICK